jgi:hypothetical protein
MGSNLYGSSGRANSFDGLQGDGKNAALASHTSSASGDFHLKAKKAFCEKN